MALVGEVAFLSYFLQSGTSVSEALAQTNYSSFVHVFFWLPLSGLVLLINQEIRQGLASLVIRGWILLAILQGISKLPEIQNLFALFSVSSAPEIALSVLLFVSQVFSYVLIVPFAASILNSAAGFVPEGTIQKQKNQALLLASIWFGIAMCGLASLAWHVLTTLSSPHAHLNAWLTIHSTLENATFLVGAIFFAGHAWGAYAWPRLNGEDPI